MEKRMQALNFNAEERLQVAAEEKEKEVRELQE